MIYATDVEPTAVIHAEEISKIKVKAGEKRKMIDYLSEPATKALLYRDHLQQGIRWLGRNLW